MNHLLRRLLDGKTSLCGCYCNVMARYATVVRLSAWEECAPSVSVAVTQKHDVCTQKVMHSHRSIMRRVAMSSCTWQTHPRRVTNLFHATNPRYSRVQRRGTYKINLVSVPLSKCSTDSAVQANAGRLASPEQRAPSNVSRHSEIDSISQAEATRGPCMRPLIHSATLSVHHISLSRLCLPLLRLSAFSSSSY